MRYRIFFLSFFCFIWSQFYAQEIQNFPIKLHWNSVQKWTSDSSSINVFSFDQAQYPSDNYLPYVVKRIEINKANSYTIEIKNPVYIPLSADEKQLAVNQQLHFTDQTKAETVELDQRENKYLQISVLPFINKNDQLLKLTSFDLKITSIPAPQKVSSGPLHTYASSSVLAQGKFVKIHITNSGIYKLTYEDLMSMGINPANVRIFGYGGSVLDQNFMNPKIDDLPEVAIWMEKGSDGIFNAGDYILFYAQGVNRWSYNSSKSMFTHSPNPYSKYGYYFVTSDAGSGKKIQDKTISVPQGATVHSVEEFTDYQLHEYDQINLCQSGKEFYGEIFNDVLSYDFPFSFPNPISVKVQLDVAAASSEISNFTLSLNGGQSKILSVAKKTDDNYVQAMAANNIFSFTPNGDNLNFNVSYTKSTSLSVGYLNYLEVNVRRQLKMAGSAMQFQNVDYLGSNDYCQYLLSSAGSNVKIWDITDPSNITNIATTNLNGKMAFTAPANTLSNYLAIDPTAASAFPKPEIDGDIPNQNLHALPEAELVIITHPNFLAQAQALAQAHRDKDNMTVDVVTTDQVYNEFSSGTPDATAYRWMVKMLYDRAIASNNTSDLPQYLLLFGRGSYDNRGVSLNSGNNFILTYQAENSLVLTSSYVTDDYFGLLDDNEGTQVTSDLLDVGVGRFTVTNAQQATDVVNKTINYMNNKDKGPWKNQLCFLADDGDAALHMRQADSVAVSVARKFPAYQVNKIYLDDFLQEITASGQSYPIAKTKFLNLVNSGLLLLDYTGHASPTAWANEGILTINDVKALTNKHLPLFVGATCDFLQFDGATVSAGENVLLNPLGGGIGILSSARPVYAAQNLTLNKLFCENLFKKVNGQNLRIGDVLVLAKNNIGSEINKLCYVYLGDPALKLNYPTTYQVITDTINQSTTVGNDTLRALSTATIHGFIADDNKSKISNFNGNLHVTIYDKAQWVTTLNNEGDGALTYSDRPNVLFSGDVNVTGGTFKFTFMLPKDIKYNFGNGRINYYAQDDTLNAEAQGYFENFVIGGITNEIINDTIGPDAKLYLNSTNFVSGGKVNETPLFFATVSDPHGINTVGSGIGHDVMLTVDNDPTQSYILNDYYQASANSYTTGEVKYKLPEMANGKHSLTFRVWDLLNNSTTESINFEVVKGLTPQLFSVYNFPNPVKSQTTIVVNHDRPETVLNTTVEIFDLAGRKIWSFSQSSADNIHWDLTTNDGRRVNPGIYLYRVSIKTKDSNVSSKTNKMLITEQ